MSWTKNPDYIPPVTEDVVKKEPKSLKYNITTFIIIIAAWIIMFILYESGYTFVERAAIIVTIGILIARYGL